MNVCQEYICIIIFFYIEMSKSNLHIKKITQIYPDRKVLSIKSSNSFSIDGYSMDYAIKQSPTRYEGDTTMGEFNGTLNMNTNWKSDFNKWVFSWNYSGTSDEQYKDNPIKLDRLNLPVLYVTVTWYITYNVTTFQYSMVTPKLYMGDNGTINQIYSYSSNASIYGYIGYTYSYDKNGIGTVTTTTLTVNFNNFPNLPFAQKSSEENDGKHIVCKIDGKYQKSPINIETKGEHIFEVYVSFYNGPFINSGSYNTSKNYFCSGTYNINWNDYIYTGHSYEKGLNVSYIE